VIVRLVERSLVIWVLRVPPGVAPRSFVGSYGTHQARKISDDEGVVPRSLVGSDGILQARKIGDDEDSTAYLFNIGSFWAVRLEDVPFLVRGSSRGV